LVALLEACLNGSRAPSEHPALPVTSSAIAEEAARAVQSGADALHIHPKDGHGADTLDPVAVAELIYVVKAAVPRVAVGLTTGAWAASEPRDRMALVRSWTVLPDFASVNWHEPGAVELAEMLLRIGIGVEAGLWNRSAVASWRTWSRRRSCLRVLLEVLDAPGADAAVSEAEALVAAVGDEASEDGSDGPRILLHGEDASAWPLLEKAAREGFAARIGLEDVLVLPDGEPADGNAQLVRTARALMESIRNGAQPPVGSQSVAPQSVGPPHAAPRRGSQPPTR
jgi:uncharacterized protein (DUF849 family)